MNQGYYIAKRNPDGSPGVPVGNDDDAVMVFDNLEKVRKVKNEMQKDNGKLSVFKIGIVQMGEVIIP